MGRKGSIQLPKQECFFFMGQQANVIVVITGKKNGLIENLELCLSGTLLYNLIISAVCFESCQGLILKHSMF